VSLNRKVLCQWVVGLTGLVIAATALSQATAPVPSAANGTFADRSGIWGNFPASRPDTSNPFFKPLGSNARTCATCHNPNDGWSVSLGGLAKRFTNSAGLDPIFLALDGTNCPSLPLDTLAHRQTASSLLLGRGLIRVELPVPASADYTVSAVTNPYGCTSTAAVSVYRRVLPTTNLPFLSDVMWDGRETLTSAALTSALVNQANDAVRGHAAGLAPAPVAAIGAAVGLELLQYTAQMVDSQAGPLDGAGGSGGLSALAATRPVAAAPGAAVFTLYQAWERIVAPATPVAVAQASIGRGERLFNTRPMSISGVAGLNDVPGTDGAVHATVVGTCGTCHNTVNIGTHATPLLLDEGQAHLAVKNVDLPLITLVQKTTGARTQVTDPGAALISGRYADVGKFKIPGLRGLAAHPPYFHNGAAKSTADIVAFYNTRFNLNLTAQESTDLINFLNAL
jgi:cytochrome c peroxidase